MTKILQFRVVLILLCLSLLAGCGGQGNGDSSPLQETEATAGITVPSGTGDTESTDPTTETELPVDITYTVSVVNRAGLPLEKVRVKIYPDEQMLNLVTMGNTDENGMFSFEAVSSGSYVAVLQNTPDVYGAEAFYAVRDTNVQIVLDAVSLNDDVYASVKLSVGDPMPDIAFTSDDGSEVKLSEMLQGNKVVVLNFWNLDCVPCKMEFPYLQSAFEQYQDHVAVIALDPFDSQASIEQFKNENAYTFAMSQCDIRLENMLSVTAHPTTVVVDRYGMICMIHTGSVPDEQPFLDLFAFFAAEDYQHTVVNDLEDIPARESN